MPGRADTELRFQATLEDNVSPKAAQLERRLKQMGATKSEIKMYIRAYDEASKKIEDVQRQIDKMPQQTVVNIRANTQEAHKSVDQFRHEVERKPILLRFQDNLAEVFSKLGDFRSKVPLPMAGAIPGSNMLYSGGAMAAGMGAAAGAVGAIQQGVQINSQMEQSMVQLTQTLKDQGQARSEMKDLIGLAQKTPFQYGDLLSADVRLRSYQIPTMEGDPGAQRSPGGKGWLAAAGDMASAMSTPITQAVEAIADARQGYFVRMMTYGIRMMREDFEKGGKFAGLTYEQGLEKALRRFEGAQEMQAKTFAGITSNLKDILQQQVLVPLGAGPFEMLKGRAQGLQERVIGTDEQGNYTKEALATQREIGRVLGDVQDRLTDVYNLVAKGKTFFKSNLEDPLKDILVVVVDLGKAFSEAFAGTLAYTLDAIGQGLLTIIKPITSLVHSMPGVFQFYGVMKALSLLGFGSLANPFLNLLRIFNPLQRSTAGLLSTLLSLPRAVAGIGIFLAVDKILDANKATNDLNAQFSELGNTSLGRLNKEIDAMAFGLGESASHMKDLVTLSAMSLPAGMKPERRAQFAEQIGGRMAQLENVGLDPQVASRFFTDFVKRLGPENLTTKGIDEFTGRLAGSVASLERLGMSGDEASKALDRVATAFASEMEKTGVRGPGGAAAFAAMQRQLGAVGTTPGQVNLGIRTGSDALRFLARGYAEPSFEQAQTVMERGRLGDVWSFNQRGVGRGARQTRRDEIGTARANIEASESLNRLVQRIAPTAAGQLPEYSVPYSGVISPTAAGALGRAPGGARDLARLRQGLPMNLDQIMGAAPGQPRAEATLGQLDKLQQYQEGINGAIAAIENASTETQKQIQGFQQASEAISLEMQKFQRGLMGQQHAIEDLGLTIQKMQFEQMRPLERQMARLSNEAAKNSFRMSEAQDQMQKYTSGLFTGEQAVLNQMHALELYNKQLQLLQMQYQSIGGELGRTEFRRGFSSRVEPLMGLNLQMQMERSQREQARKQLEYDIDFGEQRYTLQQRARQRRERTEMSLQERLAGVDRNRPVIDQAETTSRRLNREQFHLQQRMFNVNERIQDQQDRLQGLQIALQSIMQGGHFRKMQEDQADLAIALGEANKKFQAQQIELQKFRDEVEKIKDARKDLLEIFTGSLEGKGPADLVEALREFGDALSSKQGGLSDRQVRQLRTAEEALRARRPDAEDVGKKGLAETVVADAWNWFKGDFYQRLKDWLSPLGFLGTIAAATGQIVVWVTAISVALGSVVWLLKNVLLGVGALIPRFRSARVLATRLHADTLKSLTNIEEHTRGTKKWTKDFADRAASLDEKAERAERGRRAFYSEYKKGAQDLKDAINPLRRVRGFTGGMLGGALGRPGGPVGELGGRWFVQSRMEEQGIIRTLKPLAKGSKDVADGGADIARAALGFQATERRMRQTAATYRRAAATTQRASGAMRRAASRNGRTANRMTKAIDKFDDVITKNLTKAADDIEKGGRNVRRGGRNVRDGGKDIKTGGADVETGGKGSKSAARTAAETVEENKSTFRGFRDAVVAFLKGQGKEGRAALRGLRAAGEGAAATAAGDVAPEGSRAGSIARATRAGREWLAAHPGARRALRVAGVALDAAIFADIGYRALSGDEEGAIVGAVGGTVGAARGLSRVGGGGRGSIGRGVREVTRRRAERFATLKIGGRVAGRFVPGAGWALLAYDIASLIAPYAELNDPEYKKAQGTIERLGGMYDPRAIHRIKQLSAHGGNQWFTEDVIKNISRRYDRANPYNPQVHGNYDDWRKEHAREKRAIGLRSGMRRVPRDGMEAVLHQDEAVLTAAEANKWREGGGAGRAQSRGDDAKENLNQYLRDIRTVDVEWKNQHWQDEKKLTDDKEKLHVDERDKDEKRRDNAHRKERKDTEEQNQIIIDKIQKKVDKQNNIYDRGWRSIFQSTKGWIKKIAREIEDIDEDLGLTTKKKDGKAHGGMVRGGDIGKGQLIRVGEEGFDEVVIPLAPHRRDRAQSLIKQTTARLGFANGGMIMEKSAGQDAAYHAAANIYRMARGYATGGFTGPHGSGEGFNPITNFAMRKFGLQMSSGKDDHDKMTSSGNVSDHWYGRAGDFSNGVLTPQEDAFSHFWKTKGAGLVKQLIWRNKDQFNGYPIGGHEDHVHLAVLDAFAFDAERTAKAIRRLSKGLSISDLLQGVEGGVPSVDLPNVPKDIKEQGSLGAHMSKLLKRKRRQWDNRINNLLSAGAPGGPGSIPLEKGPAARKIYEYMIARGFSPAQAAGFVGVFQKESNFSTTVGNRAGSGATGLAQWLGGRLDTLKGKKNWTSLQTQLDYVWEELKGPESSAYRAIRGAKTPEEAASIIDSQYERSDNILGAPGYARQWFNRFANKANGGFVGNFQSGTQRVGASGYAKVHAGEEIRAASDVSDKKAVGFLERIEERIRKVERHLRNLDDRDEKRDARKDLANLNDQLRQAWGRRAEGVQRRESGTIRRLLRGDPSGGEESLAAVTRMQQAFRPIKREISAARTGVTRATQRLRRAQRRARRADSPGGRRITRGERQRIRRARGGLRRATGRLRRAGQAGGRFVVRQAQRGINPRLIGQAVGRVLTPHQRQLSQRISNLTAVTRRGGTLTATQQKRLVAAQKSLRNSMAKDLTRSRVASAKDHAKNRAHSDKKHAAASSREDKREARADQKQEKHTKKTHTLLEQILRKDTNVNIHNEARGATLKTTRRGGPTRSR